MGVYNVKPFLFKGVVKYDNGVISVAENIDGEILDSSEFIDELLINEKMDYRKECIPLVKEIEKMAYEHSLTVHDKE